MALTNDERAWVLSICAGLACVVGSWIICIDIPLRKIRRFKDFDIREDKRILAYGFSLSAGVMILTSMYELLPESEENLVESENLYGRRTASGLVMMASYVLGVAIFSVLNLIIHAVTKRSVVQCAHEGMDGEHSHSHGHPHSSEDHGHSHSHSHAHSASVAHDNGVQPPENYGAIANEETPLVRSLSVTLSIHGMPDQEFETDSLAESRSLSKSMLKKLEPVVTSKSLSSSESEGSVSVSSSDFTLAADAAELQVQGTGAQSSSFADLFSIGLQTSLAISLHKLPEGFITYATSRANAELGLSVFIALAIHNFIEGFTIAFPLYLALGSRLWALLAAFVLGGLSQPLGALIAWLVFRGGNGTVTGEEEEGSIVYGVLFGVVAGFLTIIGLQMFATAISISKKPSTCINWAFAGIIIVGIAMSLGDV
ncbi:Zinc/iron permease [Dipodascopsis uninucleata]